MERYKKEGAVHRDNGGGEGYYCAFVINFIIKIKWGLCGVKWELCIELPKR